MNVVKSRELSHQTHFEEVSLRSELKDIYVRSTYRPWRFLQYFALLFLYIEVFI